MCEPKNMYIKNTFRIQYPQPVRILNIKRRFHVNMKK